MKCNRIRDLNITKENFKGIKRNYMRILKLILEGDKFF